MVSQRLDPTDHLPVLPIKFHTKGKLVYLRKYLPALNKILRSKVPNRSRFYVDLFSGPGKCIDSTDEVCDGSPLIAIKTNPAFTDFIFVDINEDYCKALEKRLEGTPNTNVKSGDCNEKVNEVLSMMNTYDPCFVFLDPFGLDLKWETVRKLSKKRRMDLLINFPVGAICRSMKKEGAENTVTDCLGTDEWLDLKGHGRSSRIQLRNLYMEKIHKFFKFASPKLVYNQKNVPLYYLIYACHFHVGIKIWEYITKPTKVVTLTHLLRNGTGWVYSE